MTDLTTDEQSRDMSTGSLVFVSDANWKAAPLWVLLLVFLFGKRQRFTHLGTRFVMAWLWDAPYLIWVRASQ